MYGLEALIPLIILGIIVIIVVLPIVAAAKAYAVGRELEALRREVAKLSAKLRDLPGGAPQAQQQPQAPPVTPTLPEALITRQRPVTLQHETMVTPPPPVVPPPPTVPPPAVTPPPPAPQVPSAPPPPRPPDQRVEQLWQATEATPRPARPQPAPARSRSLSEWEMLIGGNIVNRLAAIAMVFLAAYFLKWAYDMRWITPPILVCIGFAAGLSLLFGGSRFHRRGAQVFAQGLLGAGISILYLSGYATLRYELVNQPIAFGIMSVVTAVAIVQALRYDSLVVCLLGLAGGFLTPALFGGNGHTEGGSSYFGLFAYIALLDLGLLAVGMKKDAWAAVIEPLALVGTYVVYYGWAGPNYTRSLFWTVIPFLSAVWLLFCASDTSRIVRSVRACSGLRSAVGVLNSLLFYTTVYFLIQHKCGTDAGMFRQWIVLATLSIGAVYFVNLLALLRSRAEDRSFIGRYVLTAIATLVIATSIQFEGFVRVALFAAEAFGFIWCGTRWRTRTAIWSGLTLSAIAVVMLLAQPESFAFVICRIQKTAFWNLRWMAYLAVAAATGLIAWLFARSDVDEKAALRATYQSACYALLGVSLAVETNDFFRIMMAAHGVHNNLLDDSRYVAIGGAWAAYALVLTAVGVLRRSDQMKGFGLAFLAMGTVLIAGKAIDTANTDAFTPMLNVRVLGFAVILVSILIARSVFSQRWEEGDWTRELPGVFRVAISLLAFELVTVETWQLFAHPHVVRALAPLGAEQWLLRMTALAAVWTVYSMPVVWIGVRKQAGSLTAMGLVAFGVSVATIACQGPAFAAVNRYIPLANLRGVGFGIVLLGLIAHGRLIGCRVGEIDWADAFTKALRVIASLLILELVTVETWQLFDCRSMSHAIASLGVQRGLLTYLSLGTVWVLYSVPMLWFGLRQRFEALAVLGVCALAAGVLTIAGHGFRFVPVENFRLILNLRFAAFAIAAVGMLLHYRMLARRQDAFGWVRGMLSVLQVAVSLFVFELVTAETRDLFANKPTLSSANMRGMMVSVAWLVYSFLLISFGFWKRVQTIRLVAIALFGIAILKVFFSDLSFLQQPYRMFSFGGLALILFATSYLYQRFRGVIVGAEESEAE